MTLPVSVLLWTQAVNKIKNMEPGPSGWVQIEPLQARIVQKTLLADATKKQRFHENVRV